jgi:hypothetical protein
VRSVRRQRCWHSRCLRGSRGRSTRAACARVREGRVRGCKLAHQLLKLRDELQRRARREKTALPQHHLCAHAPPELRHLVDRVVGLEDRKHDSPPDADNVHQGFATLDDEEVPERVKDEEVPVVLVAVGNVYLCKHAAGCALVARTALGMRWCVQPTHSPRTRRSRFPSRARSLAGHRLPPPADPVVAGRSDTAPS